MRASATAHRAVNAPRARRSDRREVRPTPFPFSPFCATDLTSFAALPARRKRQRPRPAEASVPRATSHVAPALLAARCPRIASCTCPPRLLSIAVAHSPLRRSSRVGPANRGGKVRRAFADMWDGCAMPAEALRRPFPSRRPPAPPATTTRARRATLGATHSAHQLPPGLQVAPPHRAGFLLAALRARDSL